VPRQGRHRQQPVAAAIASLAHDSRLLHFEAAGSNMTQIVATLLKSQGVTVHGVFLGPIDTDMNRGLEIFRKAPRPAAAQGIFRRSRKGEEDNLFPIRIPFPR